VIFLDNDASNNNSANTGRGASLEAVGGAAASRYLHISILNFPMGHNPYVVEASLTDLMALIIANQGNCIHHRTTRTNTSSASVFTYSMH